MNNIFYHSSLFLRCQNPFPEARAASLQHPGSLRAKPQGKTSLFSCAISANAGLTSMPPECRLRQKSKFLDLTVFSFFIIAKVPMNDKSGRTGNHAELLSACSYRQYIIIP